MKKRIFFIIFMFFCFSCFTFAKPMEVNDKIISYPVPEEYGFQGFTIVDDNIVGFLITYDESKSIILVININDGKQDLKYFDKMFQILLIKSIGYVKIQRSNRFVVQKFVQTFS